MVQIFINNKEEKKAQRRKHSQTNEQAIILALQERADLV